MQKLQRKIEFLKREKVKQDKADQMEMKMQDQLRVNLENKDAKQMAILKLEE